MENKKSKTPVNTLFILGLISLWLFFASSPPAHAEVLPQQPTVNVPTVTSTPLGPQASVPADQLMIYVHSGPGSEYPVVGILVAGQTVSVLGQSSSGDYVQVVYPGVEGGLGWVYRNLVSLTEALPVVTPPPPPTPTLDPTIVARYNINAVKTPLPTYTPPAPLMVPTFASDNTSTVGSGLPMGFIIIGLAVIGLFGTMLTILRGR